MMRWVILVLSLRENRNACRGLVGKSEEMRPFERLAHGCRVDIILK
jgi:hypothetical protein